MKKVLCSSLTLAARARPTRTFAVIRADHHTASLENTLAEASIFEYKERE